MVFWGDRSGRRHLKGVSGRGECRLIWGELSGTRNLGITAVEKGYRVIC